MYLKKIYLILKKSLNLLREFNKIEFKELKIKLIILHKLNYSKLSWIYFFNYDTIIIVKKIIKVYLLKI